MEKAKMILSLVAAFSTIAITGAATTEVRAANEWNNEACNTLEDEAQRAALGCAEARTAGDVGITIINTVILIAGVLAAIFIIIGGFQYITSLGDPGKTKTAKTTILYAVVGLIIVLMAFAIVNFVAGVIK